MKRAPKPGKNKTTETENGMLWICHHLCYLFHFMYQFYPSKFLRWFHLDFANTFNRNPLIACSEILSFFAYWFSITGRFCHRYDQFIDIVVIVCCFYPLIWVLSHSKFVLSMSIQTGNGKENESTSNLPSFMYIYLLYFLWKITMIIDYNKDETLDWVSTKYHG